MDKENTEPQNNESSYGGFRYRLAYDRHEKGVKNTSRRFKKRSIFLMLLLIALLAVLAVFIIRDYDDALREQEKQINDIMAEQSVHGFYRKG